MLRSRRWSLWIGSVGETPVFLHASMLPMLLIGLYLGYLHFFLLGGAGVERWQWLSISAIAVGVWLVSLAVHEAGHLLMARAIGVDVPVIVLGPVGNLAFHDHSQNVRADFLVAVAGWTVQWGLCTVAAAALLLQKTPLDSVVGLLHPIRPELMADAGGATLWLVLRLAFWVNWCLLLLHSLPVWPFDGYAIVQFGLLTWAPDLSRRTALAYTASLARLLALVCLVGAWVFRADGAGSPMPTWLPLLGLAGVLYLNARIRPWDLEAVTDWPVDRGAGREGVKVAAESFLVAGDSESSSSAPPESANWWHKHQARRLAARRAREQAENRRVDDILRRVHDVGLEGLTREERSLLHRVSERWRNERRGRGDGAE